VDGGANELGFDDGFGRNDLQPVAQQRCPEVQAVATWLESRFGNSRMSGSGSAVFARVGTEELPSAAWPAGDLPAGWVARMCRSLDHHPLLGWAG
jgi:4-diphosphocytidyl-2-C-methyl-D-erythritol kinase